VSLRIRPAEPEDAPDVARIYVDSWNAGFGHLMPARPLDVEQVAGWAGELAAPGESRWWVAERSGHIVGFVGIGPSRDPVDATLGEVDTIAVDPPAWRNGVGRALMATAIDALTAAGYLRAILWTIEGYEQGQRFYESQGWVRDGRWRDDGRQIAFRRTLPEPSDEVAQSGSNA
jgi:GNAT superfamily N-acetyltransferase